MKKNASDQKSKQEKTSAKLRKQLQRVMPPEQIEKYLQYANSTDAYAVLFVKKYLTAAQNLWIDILENDAPGRYRETRLEFHRVACALYPRIIHPKYPKKKPYETTQEYKQICRAITWKTAHADIAQQRSKGLQGRLFELFGCIMPDADGKLKYHFLSFNELSSEQTEYQKDRIPLAGYGAEPHYKSIGDTLL